MKEKQATFFWKKKVGKENLLLILFGIGIILISLNLIYSADTTSSFTGGSSNVVGSFTGGTGGYGGGTPTYSTTTTSSSSGSYTGGGSFQGGTYSSFSGNPYSYVSGGYGVYGASSNPQFNNPSFFSGANFVSPEVYWPKYTTDMCLNRQDFLVQIAPGGCSPAVVRSDLLEEQPVPVFCQLMSLTINPLIEVSKIRSISFRGQYPKGISGISYYPARAAVGSQQNLISSPINDNLGYVVIILARQEKEAAMPEYLEGNVTATVNYDMQGAFGTGNTNFYVSEMSDEDWTNNYKQYGFWNGKGYIRADSIASDQVTLSIYQDVDSKQSTVTLQKGQTSGDIYLSGFYCAAGMNIRVDSIGAPVDSALVRINDEQMWVSKGDKIMDSKCTVSTLDAYAGGGRITVNCPVQNGRIDLSLASGKANLSVNGVAGQYNIGDRVDDNRSIYLGYVGQDYKSNNFVVLVADNYSSTYAEFQDKNVYAAVESALNSNRKEISDTKLVEAIKKKVRDEYKKKLTGTTGKTVDKDIDVQIVTKDSSALGISLVEATSPKDKVWDFTKEEDKLSKEYYDWAIKYYEDLISLYPNEKIVTGTSDVSYAEQALYESAELSKKYGMNEKALEYYDRLIRDYPTSSLTNLVIRERDLFLRYGESNSKAMVNVNGASYFVELLDFRKPTREDASAVLLINGKEETVGIEEIKTFENKTGGDRSIQIKSMNDNSVTISYSRTGFDISNYYSTTSASSGTRSQIINLGQQIDLEGVRIKVLSINLKKQAKIFIQPKAFGPMTQANFSFKIGIEKRNIKLSTDQTKDLIKTLQDNIKQWGDINEKLGNVITGLKTACFATSAVLNVKNLLSGWSGESMARKDIMTKSGGWNEFCEKEVSAGRAISVTKCLLDNNGKINDDIDIYKKEIDATNERLKKIQESLNIEKRDILDLNGQVDSKKLEDKFAEEFNTFCRSQNGEISLPDRDNTTVTFNGDKGICNWNTLTQDQRRNIMTLLNTRNDIAGSQGSDVLKDMINKQLGSETLNAKNYWEHMGALKKEEENAKQYDLGQRTIVPDGDRITYGDVKTITQGDIAKNNVYSNFNNGESVVRIFIPYSESFNGVPFNADSEVAGKEIIVSVTRQTGGDFTISPDAKVYLVNGAAVSITASNSVKEYMGKKQLTKFRESNAKAYQNKMIDRGNLLVKYFEQAPYKGLPAEVPFDVDNGWYVELTYVLSGFGKPYDESGRAVNFYICNVGPNNLIEFQKSADDICRLYNGNSDADLGFPGMSTSDSRNLLMRAQQAITEAAKQYGKKQVIIGRNTFKSGVALGGESGRCSDFMSPMDCNIMFNVCDPVMCPASRCDLGGNYRVDNVVQTGVIGSLVLCLPNAKEGILMPICLSGIHAGLEGYISIMNSTVACLNESLATGKNIGICDEIKSIYLCEFFWKEATPLLNVIIPRIVESFYSQGVRGGGEYLTVQNAWDNMRASIDYFRNDYALTSMQAFQARTTEEIGGEVCKSFMSATYPTQDLLQKLVEPDSPVQYTGWFSEETFTTATIPSTSHYKVYYHIFAGKDNGAYYVVYLKDLPQSNYIYSSQVYVVDRGYIATGSQVDQAKDFTAVSGYKQLCVSINGKDECGFGKVTSSYLINSLTDSYAATEASTVNIKSSTECVAGTPSLISAINPNLQAGVESVINPQLYNNGIIRVCATYNPGKAVLPNGQYDTTNSTFDRWKDVGYCDDPTLRCWLDTSSVKDIIVNKQILNETLQTVTLNTLGAVDFMTEAQSIAYATQADSAIKALSVTKGESQAQIENKISGTVKMLIDLSNLGFSNKYRARALYLLGSLYNKVAESFIDQNSIGFAQPVTYSTINIAEVMSETTTTNNPTTNWNGFYDNSDPYNITLKVYNYDKELDELIQIEYFDISTGKVTMLDGTAKLATIVNNHVVLTDWTETVDNTATTDTTNNTDTSADSLNNYYEFQDGTMKVNLYYRYVSGWQYSSDSVTWNSITNFDSSTTNPAFSDKDKSFIPGLKGKSCDDGLKLLIVRTLQKNEGGLFSSPALVIHSNGESNTLKLDNPNNIKCSNVKDFI